MSNQLFPRGSTVKVSDHMPPEKSHFPKGFKAVVEYTYSQQYGGPDVRSYSLIQLEYEKPINAIAWYDESQLELLSDDTVVGLRIIEEYRYPTANPEAAK